MLSNETFDMPYNLNQSSTPIDRGFINNQPISEYVQQLSFR